jgi:DNA ligase (NAD+)
LEAVDIAGSTVSRATLHNADEIEKKDIRINDYVFLEKAGEIIPAIVSVDAMKRTENCKPFKFPTNCPSCGCELIRRENEVAWRCPNPKCKAQLRCKIMYFVSKSAMGIDNLGEVIVEKLVNSGRLKTIADVYGLTYGDLIALPKLGQKSALSILKNIDSSKTQPLWKFVNGLGIFGVGEQTAKDLCKKFRSIDELATAKTDELSCIDGIGGKTVQSIIDFFSNTENRSIIENFKRHGLLLADKPSASQGVSNFFDGKTFALTGALERFTRVQVKEIIEANGGRVSDAISSKTNIVIRGSCAGSKLAKAQELGIEIWDEDMFTANSQFCSHPGQRM